MKALLIIAVFLLLPFSGFSQAALKQKYEEILTTFGDTLDYDSYELIKEGFLIIKNRNYHSLSSSKEAKKKRKRENVDEKEYFIRFENHWNETFKHVEELFQHYKGKITVQQFCGELGVIFMGCPC